MTPEEQRAYNRAYYQEHKETILIRQKAYNRAHRERLNAYQRAYLEEKYHEDTCKILKEHKQALADDPERLSTDFILRLVQGDDA